MNTIIVEGFDMVGKSAVLEKYAPVKAYRPDYSTIYDNIFKDRNHAVLVGLYQSEMFAYLREVGQLGTDYVVYDRAAPSSWVYSQLYKGDVSIDLCVRELDNFVKCCNENEYVTIYYVRHSSVDSAERIYKYDTNHNEPLDKFDDFNQYWTRYIAAGHMYLRFFTYLNNRSIDRKKIRIVPISTVSAANGSYVTLVELTQGLSTSY